jgi:uncharacterized protein YrrD/ElaB/YqjD/DUF883 family membrane-anchored ribosome-binding protein
MSDASLTLKQSDLLGRLVLNRSTMAEMGRVEFLWLNPKDHQIVGMTCKSGLLGREKHRFSWSQIGTIGNEGILVNPADIEPEQPNLTLETVVGHELWTDSGNKAGVIKDLLIDIGTGTVVNYLFASSGWRGIADGIYTLAPSAIESVGDKRLLVKDAAVQTAEQYAGGLTQKASQAAVFLKEDYQRTKEDMASAVQGGRSLAEQAREKLASVSEQAKERSQSLTEQAKAAAEQAREKLANVSEQAKERSQSLTEQAKAAAEQAREKLADVSEQAKERSQSLTEQAKAAAEQAREKLADAATSAKDRGQALQEGAKEQLAEATDRLQQTAETAADKLAEVKSDLENPPPPKAD